MEEGLSHVDEQLASAASEYIVRINASDLAGEHTPEARHFVFAVITHPYLL